MSQLENALAALARGFFVFPCVPRTKRPLTDHGFKDASNSEEQIREWWKRWPRANPAVALGASQLTVLDIDRGLSDIDQARDWCHRNKIPPTFSVRSGRQESFGMHLYFRGLSSSFDHKHDSTTGEVKSSGRYVMAAGAAHPSGGTYTILADHEIAPVPELVKQLSRSVLPRPHGPIVKEELIPAGIRHSYLLQRGQELYFAGLYGKRLTQALVWLYEDRCERDAEKDRCIESGEIANIVRWVEAHPPEYPLKPGDFRAWRHAEKDPLARQAWAADLTQFDNNSDRAFTYLFEKLMSGIGCPKEQAFRIIDASPLAEHMRNEFPVPDFLENVGRDDD